ncbi:MAG TPA: inositol monophosphatase [Blastocatellia bacterium]|nr:inositol monophosphatase [Blastocatellia bacterium]
MDKRQNELRSIAVQAVISGMDVIKTWRESGNDIAAQHTGLQPGDDYITAVDYAAEAAVIEVLQRLSPNISIVGEMSGGHIGKEPVWVIDPMDGTTDFVSGGSFVAVTVALLDQGQPIIGATGCPFTGEVWSAAKGFGASDIANRHLRIDSPPIGRGRIALDPVKSGITTLKIWTEIMERLANTFEEVQPLPAIALEMAYVAAGKFDGFVQIGGSPIQDFAAGTLLIREAGGIITGIDGNPNPWESNIIVAGRLQVYRQLIDTLKNIDRL